MFTGVASQESMVLETACGRKFANTFKTMKLIRDERHRFHVVYKTFSNDYIYSFCDPFLDTFPANTYTLISEDEAKRIFLTRLSQENARELFTTAEASVVRMHS
jgi:hypothetical protein